MSGPFRFNQEEARSPLDRSASPFTSGQPVSFKTNVNRAKTKKWVQAKKNAYDGDDWGEYDEYDEYGVNREPEQVQTPAQRYYAQRTEQPSRSFTDPSQQAPLPRGRRNSFEHGEEQRAFSSTIPSAHSGHAPLHVDTQGHASSSSNNQGRDDDSRSDFSPTALPPPLQTRISQVPTDFNANANTQFPPRKSSIGAGASPIATSPRSRKGSQTDKPLPFIRPADIYKRHQEEQARASLDSGRPSIDSLTSPLPHDAASTQDDGKSLQPMETVVERKSEYLPDFDATSLPADKQPSHQQDDEGLRSVVDQAFTRTDESRSVPPTPISNDSGSDLLRSNTGSTSGISPIMSRVPSSATSALKARNQAEGSTPAIAEEPSEATTPVTQPTSAIAIEPMHRVPRKPSPGHSRNFSSSSDPRSGLATPTRGDSPARSPVLTPSKGVPEPVSALVTTESNDSSEAMEGGLKGPSAAYAAREADIASAARKGSDAGASDLGAAERQSQNTFLDSHNAQSPIEDVLPRDRSESPSKGRVQALAGKFGEVASSRRGSTQSIRSRNSVQSWERSRDNSRSASPTKASHSKPSSPVKEFRPHLPGQWESYATTTMTPSEHGEQDRGLNRSSNDLTSLDKPDLTPTTPKQPVVEITNKETETSDPISAPKDAGATTVGADESASDNQQEKRRSKYLPRPLSYRTLNSSPSAPPSPPAKDTPESEFPPPAPLKDKPSEAFKSQPERPTLDPQLSTETTAEDEESDRLRKEIVASLSPFGTSESLANDPSRSSLQATSPEANRASSILPSEYETYWASEDRASRQSFQDAERNAQVESPAATVTFLPQSDEPTKPVINSRFSWEVSNPRLQAPDEQTQNASTVEPTKSSQDIKTPSPTMERAPELEHESHPEGIPDSYFGPGHALAVIRPEPVNEPNRPAPSPPADPIPVVPSPTREETHSPGLHVVNTEFNQEAVDIPPRLSADNRQSKESSPVEKQQPEAPAQQPSEQHADVSPLEAPKTPTVTQEVSAKSPTSDKPLGAREIATLNSASERIETYNKTRDYWATADHGLGSWLASTLEAHPELATQTYPIQRVPTSSTRHRHTGSLLFGKLAGSSSNDVGAEQHTSASAPVPSSPAAAAPSSSGFGGRIANQQMQLKGKDLLHTANVLSGKGMTSAKGFFAKGKSRFGREKATSHTRTESAPASRNVSEEPELVVRRSRAPTGLAATLMRSATQKETESASPGEEKKKRRFSFSTQFRRASRSRSRPSSVALPNNIPLALGTTPKPSPPRELHQFLMGDDRGNSFHKGPDSWDNVPGVPPTALNSYFSATTPQRLNSAESRLGILPSPAKSAFSNPDKDAEQHVPPVPAIPDEVAIRHYRRRSSQDSASHRILQSVIRYATPPVPSRHSTPSAITRDIKIPQYAPVLDTGSGAQENIRDSGFLFGFADEAPNEARNDDDDLPPKLHHDAPSASTYERKSPYTYTNEYMNVSDNDSDDERLRGRDISTLPGLDAGQRADSISPVLAPFAAGFGEALKINHGPRQDDSDGIASTVDKDAERALSLVWFTKSDLQLSKLAVKDAARKHASLPTRAISSLKGSIEDPGDVLDMLGSTGFGEITTPAHQQVERDGETSLNPGRAGGSVAADSGTLQTRRVSASPIHQVGDEANSSAASWKHVEIDVQSHAGAERLAEMRGDSSLVAPPAQVPRIVQSSPGTPKATESHADNFQNTMSNGQFRDQAGYPEFRLQTQQLQASNSAMVAPERSRSILSQISAMVSDEGSAPYSQASTGRSTPSTIRRMQPESSMKPSMAPAQIPEESPTWHTHHPANGQDDDYDLYADHNGVVKDVRDDRGRPLRIAHSQASASAGQPQPIKSSTPNTGPTPEPRDEERPRFSFERPMSFISGANDQDGKPQDQINRSNEEKVPDGLQSHVQHPFARQSETVYSTNPPTHMDLSPNHARPTPGSGQPKNILRAVKSIDPINKNIHLNPSHQHGEPSSRPGPSDRHDISGQPQENGPISNRSWHNAMGRRTASGQPGPSSSMDYPQDLGRDQAPRNQYESHQQMMQQQAQNPQSQAPSAQPPAQEILQQQEKPSAKPGLSSMLKGLGAKAQVSSNDHSTSGNTSNPGMKSLPTTSNGLQSDTNGFPHQNQDFVNRTIEQPRSFEPPIRPGMVQQSFPNGVESQQPSVTSHADTQPRRPFTAGAPETNKKKRFSGLGALFGRGVAAGDGLTAKFKLSKEDKKAQKARQSSPAPPAVVPAPQWASQQQSHKPPQSGLAYYPPGQLPPHTVQSVQPVGPGYVSTQNAQNQYAQRPLQQSQQTQPPQLSMTSAHPGEASAFLATKQRQVENRARQRDFQSRQTDAPENRGRQPLSNEQGAYAASLAARQQAEHDRQQRLLRQQESYRESRTEQFQPPHHRQPSGQGQSVYGDSRHMQQQAQQHSHQNSPDYLVHQARLAEQQQMQREQGQPQYERGEVPLTGDSQNQMQRQHSSPPPTHNNASRPSSRDSYEDQVPVSQPATFPTVEPRYEAPPIPAAYSHVSGAFVSPLDRPYLPQHDSGMHVSRDEFGRHYSDPRMPAISPQVSARSHPPNHRTHSDASTVSVVSPISNSPGMPSYPLVPGGQRAQKPRMSSISEVHQQNRPWHLNFPVGTTEQDIVRARQDQYMQARFTAQQQQQAERAAGSPSPRPLTPTSAPPHVQVHGGGFKEVLPRSSPQTRVSSPNLRGESLTVRRIPTPVQPTPVHPGEFPQHPEHPPPMFSDPSILVGSVNSNSTLPPPPPPPKIPHSPMGPTFPNTMSPLMNGQQHIYNHPSPDHKYRKSPHNIPQYDEEVSEEAPPSYDGPGVTNDGLDKNRPEVPRPPNIRTDMDMEARRHSDTRRRQASIGILQHPQPASMAASPQRTEADMGADSLRLQLSRQENLIHMQRLQREQQQREVRQRERREREAARARARELERSVSGGGQVGSLRSVGGSSNGGAPGWERRGSHSRPVFELPADDDDEPTMKATSYPGQEWVPPMWDVD
ncbi:hypothetical protein TUN205_00756 [Pyrenophora tritici-repentis]|nr:hypothetical protein TUN205_00756 [Pyrenophora tritici-repentis]